MSPEEYRAAYQAAADSFPALTREAMSRLAEVYQTAAEQVAAAVRTAELNELSQLTVGSKQAIEAALRSGATAISEAVEAGIPELVTGAYGSLSAVDSSYLLSAVGSSGAGGLITASGLESVAVQVDAMLVEAMVTRSINGVTFAERIWGELDDRQLPLGVFGDYTYRLQNVISAGLAQGRDVIKIAEDLTAYVADGKVALVQRYGDLERGTASFLARISDRVDWRALRLARSELYASMQLSSANAGAMNPGALDLFDWVLTVGADHEGCECPDLAAGSPYTQSKLPSYPHPNCLCHVVPRLRDREEFVADLTAWSNGEAVGYLDEWYESIYLPALAA